MNGSVRQWFDNALVELRTAPLGTLGAVAGVVTLVADLIPGFHATGTTRSAYSEAALAIIKSASVIFVFSYISGKLSNEERASKYIFLLIGSIAASLISAAILDSFKQNNYPNQFGGALDGFGFIAIVLSLLYVAIFFETSKSELPTGELSSLKYAAYLLSALIGTIVMNSPFSGLF